MARSLPTRTASYLLLLVLAAACFFLPTALADAATYYVATDGDNANPGTIDQPFATLRRADDAVAPGDTIFVRGGVYRVGDHGYNGYTDSIRIGYSSNPNGTPESPITLKAYPGERVIVDNANPQGGYYAQDAVRLHGNYWIVDGIEFCHGDYYLFTILGDNNVIRNCKFYDSDQFGYDNDMLKILNQAGDQLVEYCEFWGTTCGNFIDIMNSAVEVRYCYFHDFIPGFYPNTQVTVLSSKGGVHDCKIHHNIFARCVAPGVPEYEWNEYGGHTVELGGGTSGNTLPYEAERMEFYNNLIYGGYWGGIFVKEALDTKIYNNTIVIEDTVHRQFRPGIRVEDTCVDTTIKNNIIVSKQHDNPHMMQVETGGEAGLVCDHNLYWATQAQPFFSWQYGYIYPDLPQVRKTFDEWRQLSGLDQNSIVQSPAFVNMMGGDFHLAHNSPAIDAGIYELGVPSDDFDGNPRPYGDAIDIGAYEYTGAGGGNEPPVLAWVGETGYESDGLDPETGSAGADFTWKIEYSDPDSDAPYGVYLHVLEDGTELGDSPYDMMSEGGDDWSAGVVFAKMLNLPKGNDYTYYFSAADEHGAQTSYPATPLAGPQVNNSPPTAPSVAISPESPTDQDELQATAEGSTDIDEGDEISYELQWYCDDLLQEDLTEATVLATRTSVGEAWRCEVVATDGQDDSEAGSAEVTITAAYSISGTILDTDSNPVADVNVTAGDNSATTAADGTYAIQSLPAGTYTVTPSLAEYGFDPGSQEVTVNETQGDASAVDFTASQEIYSISGIVTSVGSGLQGVQVAASGHSTATAAGGTYTIGGLIAGTYTVTPALAGYGFVPENVEISVGSGEGSATGVDFVGGIIFTLTVPAGLSLVGVPCTPLGDSSPGSLFGDAAVVRWDPIALQYVASDPGAGPATEEFLAVAPSKGYFVYTSEAQELRIAGEPAGTAAPFAGVGLSPGWNMVANPFCEELPFANFLTHTTNIRPYGFTYDWDANSYRVVIADGAMAVGRTSLLPGEGIWVCAVESGTLTVEPPMGTSAQAAQRQEEPQHDGWTIPIAARAAGRADLSSLAGVTGTEVSWQIYNPPSVPDSVDVYGGEWRSPVGARSQAGHQRQL